MSDGPRDTAQTGPTLTVEAKVMGRRPPLISGWQVPLPPRFNTTDAGQRGETATLLLRDLLSVVIEAEVEGFRNRQEDRRLTRVLAPEEIATAASRGKIEMGGVGIAPQEVDEQEAIHVALQAFTDGLYFVFLDGVQQSDLEAVVQLQVGSTMTFIRLVALAGG